MAKKKRKIRSKSYQLRKDHFNYEQNKPIGINRLENLFNNARLTHWYIMTRRKIILINLLPFNRRARLRKQKAIFTNFFNQYYSFDFNIINENWEFTSVYNSKMTIFKIFKPY